MKSFRLVLFAAFSLLLLSMTGCSYEDFVGIKNLSTYGEKIDDLIVLIGGIAVPGFLITVTVLIFAVMSFTRKKGKSEYDNGISGKVARNILIFDAIIFFLDLIILYGNVGAWNRIEGQIVKTPSEIIPSGIKKEDVVKEKGWYLPVSKDGNATEPTHYKADEVLEIKVVARQFLFQFTYPGKDNELGTDDDFTIDNILRIPAGKKIVVDITTPNNDVVHSFYLKQVRVKQDCIPGRSIRRWFEIDPKRVENSIEGLGSKVWDVEIDQERLEGDVYYNAVGLAQLRKDVHNKGDADGKIKKQIADGVAKAKAVYKEYHLGARLSEIACAELCGEGHYRMNAWMVIDPKDKFDAWYKKAIEENS